MAKKSTTDEAAATKPLDEQLAAAVEAHREAVSQRHIAENEVSQLRARCAANNADAELGQALLDACKTLADRTADENSAMSAKVLLEQQVLLAQSPK